MSYYLFNIISGKRSMSYSVGAQSEIEARLRLQISLQGFALDVDSIELVRVYEDNPAHIQA